MTSLSAAALFGGIPTNGNTGVHCGKTITITCEFYPTSLVSVLTISRSQTRVTRLLASRSWINVWAARVTTWTSLRLCLTKSSSHLWEPTLKLTAGFQASILSWGMSPGDSSDRPHGE